MLGVGKLRVLQSAFVTLIRFGKGRIVAHQVYILNGMEKPAREIRRVHSCGHGLIMTSRMVSNAVVGWSIANEWAREKMMVRSGCS